MVDQNMCPVCGYGMEEPPEQYNICASCGTEFGVHDVNASIEELRVAWLRTGPNWFSSVDPEPQDWKPFLQITGVMLAQGPFPATSVLSYGFSSLASSSVSKPCSVEVKAAPRSQIFCEPIKRNVGSADTPTASLASS